MELKRRPLWATPNSFNSGGWTQNLMKRRKKNKKKYLIKYELASWDGTCSLSALEEHMNFAVCDEVVEFVVCIPAGPHYIGYL